MNGPTIEDAIFAAYMQLRPLEDKDCWRLHTKTADVLLQYMAPKANPPPSLCMGIPVVIDPTVPEDEVRLVGKRETVIFKIGKLVQSADYAAQ